jgi:hypothetical protein|tara:strand:+ start:589 stop:774 length:186 start_codon:yes stop_codon:yes gene_type:complete
MATRIDEVYDEITELYAEFMFNHDTYRDKSVKAAALRARKNLGDIKKLVTEYRKASVEETS